MSNFKTKDLLIATYLRLCDEQQSDPTYVKPMPDEVSSNRNELWFTFKDEEMQKLRIKNIDPSFSRFFELFHSTKNELNKELKTAR